MNAYEQKRTARIERLEAAAERTREEAARLHQTASNMASVIPFGQPILVGHHSEKRDRNYRNNIFSKYEQSFKLQNKADELEARAEAARKNKAIFSDDPDAAEKLEDKLARLEQRQELMKAANKLVRKNDREGLLAMGYTESSINKLFTPDFCGRVGYADYEIKNNNANIRRIKQRIEHLNAHKDDVTEAKEINGIRIVDNAEANRLQIFFDGKPDQKIITALKSSGFRWTPSLMCWQAYRSNRASYNAEIISQMM